MLLKRFLFSVMVLALIIGPAGLSTSRAHAQETNPDVVTFTMLGESELALKGPAASATVDFTLPAEWEMMAGGELHLTVHVYSGQEDTGLPGNQRSVQGLLSVWLNDTWLQTITFSEAGDFTFVIPLQPLSAWLTTPRNSLQSLRFSLEDAQTCTMLQSALAQGIVSGINIVIQPTSYLVMPHRPAPAPLDLQLFPFPIYQGTFLPEQAVLVMPSQPTEGELQAVVTVASVLGKTSKGKLPLTYTTADLLSAAALEESQVIFVGKPSAFPQLSEATLPIPFNGNSFEDAQIEADDGVVQLVASPHNPAKAWLLVSGATETALIKAAQALGSGAILPAVRRDVAIVAKVEAQPVQTTGINATLRDLGYGSRTLTGYGDRYATYWVNIPADYTVSNGAYFDLTFAASSLMNYEESGLILDINDFFVGGVRYSDRTSTLTTYRFPLPPEALRTGENLLIIQSSQHAYTPCVSYNDIWLSISSQSRLYVPIEPMAEHQGVYDLKSYPLPLFAFFGNTAFVVAREDLAGWGASASIAFDLGTSPRGALNNPIVVYGDSVPDNVRKNYDLLIVGRASTLPIVGDLASALPAPFPAGQDTPVDPEAAITFKIPSGSTVGYLQSLASPWNSNRGILVVAGSNAAGLQTAAHTLVTPALRGLLSGNFAMATENQVISRAITVKQEATSVVPTAIPATPAETNKQVFKINIVTIGIVVAGLVALLAFIYWLTIRRRRAQRPEEAGKKPAEEAGKQNGPGSE